MNTPQEQLMKAYEVTDNRQEPDVSTDGTVLEATEEEIRAALEKLDLTEYQWNEGSEEEKEQKRVIEGLEEQWSA